jgi:hypothetical protein
VLLGLCREHDDAFRVLHSAARKLYPFAVEVRYPFGLSVSEKEAAEALHQVHEVRETVLATLGF